MTTNEPNPEPRIKSWLVQELIWLLGTLFTGLLILPAMVYVVGVRLFGAYKGSGPAAGITAFYGDFAQDLVTAHLSSWTVALGPLVLTYLLRLILRLPPPNLAALWQMLPGTSKSSGSSKSG